MILNCIGYKILNLLMDMMNNPVNSLYTHLLVHYLFSHLRSTCTRHYLHIDLPDRGRTRLPGRYLTARLDSSCKSR